MRTTVVVQAASGPDDTPGIEALPDEVEIRFAANLDDLQTALPGADVIFSWDYRGVLLPAAWGAADSLRWVHWAGAGVDAALFPELTGSDITLTNSAGIFDQPIAEFVLGLILAFAKQLPESLSLQASHEWRHRLNEQVAGRTAVVVGVGGIGRATCRLLRAAGMTVIPVGRNARRDAELGQVHGSRDLPELAVGADVLVSAAPLTADTRGMFDATVFASMPHNGRFINIGRGALVDEPALISALERGELGGAGLDVFATEPLPTDSPLWDLPNVIITPHHAGDHTEHRPALVALFVENLERYLSDQPLRNVVDKRLGYVPTL